MKALNLVVVALVIVVTALTTHYVWPLKPLPPAATPSQPHAPVPFPQTALAPNSAPAGMAPPLRQPSPPPSPWLITPEIRAKFDKARLAAFAAKPALKAEEEDLTKQRMALVKQNPPASPQDRTALTTKWKDHAQKMRDAMVKADPSLQPIFADLDARIKSREQQIQQQQGHFAPASGTPNPAPATSGTPPLLTPSTH